MNTKRITCTCEDCGRVIEGQAYEFEGMVLCEDCFDEETVVCEFCGERMWTDNAYYIDDTWMCCSCHDNRTFYCDSCHETHLYRDCITDGNIEVCRDCYEDHYYRCEDCDCIVHEDDLFNDDGEYLCYDCYNSRTKRIHDYYYKPDPIFHGHPRMGRYFGVELEIDGGGESNDSATELLYLANEDVGDEDNIYIKRDGSLCNGMELVSHPASLEYHMNEMHWQEVMKRAVNLGYRSHQTNSCGLHVHVDRNSLGCSTEEQEETIAKILFFVELHWNELFRFTRRSESNICRWAARVGYEKTATEVYNKAKDRSDYHEGRYLAVNLKNTHTIEFRLFRGTLKYNTFIATLQLVNIICEIAMNLTEEEINKMSWSEFVQNIVEEELIQYLKERDLYVNDIVMAEEEM